MKKIWESVLEWQKLSAVTAMVSTLSDQWLSKHASDTETASTFKQLLENADHKEFMSKMNEAERWRPFVSNEIWALYAAYHGFLSARFAKASLLAIPGLAHAEILRKIDERSLLVETAPPEILKIYDQSNYHGTEPYLRYIRESMISQFSGFLSGARAGNAAAVDAAAVLKAAEDLVKKSLTTASSAGVPLSGGPT